MGYIISERQWFELGSARVAVPTDAVPTDAVDGQIQAITFSVEVFANCFDSCHFLLYTVVVSYIITGDIDLKNNELDFYLTNNPWDKKNWYVTLL